MANSAAPIVWKGEYYFQLSGSGLHEDTLKIKSNSGQQEKLLRLVLPTLCITYADAKFQDDIGGEQENYPASRVYGPAYFDPPVELLGDEEIEKFTYIRGAHRVWIGPDKTVIDFYCWQDLVIPRLRISQKNPAEAGIEVPDIPIAVDQPLKVTVKQYADGRHVGGVRMEKRHPAWKEVPPKETYSLWIRVIDGFTLRPLPEMIVDIFHWDPKMRNPYGRGGFCLSDRRYTDGDGCIEIPDRPSGQLEAYVVRRAGSRAVVRCLRPLAGQNVRLHMRVWPMKQDTVRIKWPAGDHLDIVAQRTGQPIEEMLAFNRLKGSIEPKPGMNFNLPCYLATYHMEPWDTFDRVAHAFGYEDAEGLAEANGLRDPEDLNGLPEIKLPDWHFFYAQEHDTLEKFDEMLELPKGSTITVGRAFHPDPRLPYPGEVVAAPTPLFAERLKSKVG